MIQSFLLFLALCAPPYRKMYDLSDLVFRTPNFDNAPNFSMSLGMAGSVPILVNHPYITEIRDKMKIEEIICGLAEVYGDKDLTVMFWIDNTMVLITTREVHRALELF